MRPLGVGEELLGPRRALLEELELARDRLSTALALLPQRDAADHDDEEPDDDEHEPDQERGQDHAESLETASPGSVLVPFGIHLCLDRIPKWRIRVFDDVQWGT